MSSLITSQSWQWRKTMTEWFTSTQLAGLPGLPTTDRAVRIKANKEHWESRAREVGKGVEYRITSLPTETRAHLAKQAAATIADQVSDHASAGRAVAAMFATTAVAVQEKLESGRKLLSMKPEQRAKADARLLIIQAADRFLASYKACGQGEIGRRIFVDAYKQRELALPDSVYQQQRPFSAITLRRWQDKLESEGLASLAGNYEQKKESALDCNRDLATFLTALITLKPHLSNKWQTLHELAEEYSSMNERGWLIPSPSSLRRWLSNWISENKVAFTYATNPDAYNNQYRTAIETMYPWMTAPNDVWEFDSTPVDAMLVDGRHSIIAVIDVFTRRVRLLVAKTSSSEGICLLLRKTLLSWGTINDNGVMRTDNGSDYVSKRVMGICNMLDINVSRSNAYSGWEKPHIERFFRTLSHGLIELLPSYIGHCVSDRVVIEARKSFAQRLAEKRKPEEKREAYQLAMTADELQTLLDNWLTARYHNKKHGTLGMSPNEKYQQSRYQRSAVISESALDLLLNHVGEATVSKGFIKANNLKYTAPELMEHTWKGQQVRVFLDPSDVGRAVLYRVDDWNARVEAINVELIGNGITPDAFRASKREDNKALARFRREMNLIAKTLKLDELHTDVVNHFVSQAKEISQFKQADKPLENSALSALTGVLDQQSAPTYSDDELASLTAKREAMERKTQELEQQRGLIIRDEHQKARFLAEESLRRELTDKESEWLEQYKRANKLGAKTIEKIMAGRQQISG
jgi:putative transposase